MKTIISSANAPAAIGPYSQCVKAGSLVFPSGQLPINPATGEMVTNDIKKATVQCLDNIKALLEEAGSSLDKAIKVSVYLSDLNDFAAMNEVYSTYFPENPPARLCVEVAKLPKDSQIEIDAIATTN